MKEIRIEIQTISDCTVFITYRINLTYGFCNNKYTSNKHVNTKQMNRIDITVVKLEFHLRDVIINAKNLIT